MEPYLFYLVSVTTDNARLAAVGNEEDAIEDYQVSILSTDIALFVLFMGLRKEGFMGLFSAQLNHQLKSCARQHS